MKRTMITLQPDAILGNETLSCLAQYLPDNQLTVIRNFVNGLAVRYTSVKSTLQGTGRYNRIINLSDNRCNRKTLLNELIKQSKENHVVDLFIFGHGAPESILLKGEQLTGGVSGNIRSMLTEARKREGSNFKFKLRLVFMGVCFGASLNDDWMRIGARASVGSEHINYMVEPMSGIFVHNFILEQRTVSEAAQIAFNESKNIWLTTNALAPFIGVNLNYTSTNDPACSHWGGNQPKRQECMSRNKIDMSKTKVDGDGKLIFNDQFQLRIGQQKRFKVKAKNLYNFLPLFLHKDEEYKFSANGQWKNGPFITSGPDGYTPGPFDGGRRQPNYNMFTLVGESFRKHKDPLSYDNVHFKIGSSNTLKIGKNGYLNAIANDALVTYFDNDGEVELKVKRTK